MYLFPDVYLFACEAAAGFGLYVVTGFREMKLLRRDGVWMLGREQRKLLVFSLGLLLEHSLDSVPSVVINNTTVLFFL